MPLSFLPARAHPPRPWSCLFAPAQSAPFLRPVPGVPSPRPLHGLRGHPNTYPKSWEFQIPTKTHVTLLPVALDQERSPERDPAPIRLTAGLGLMTSILVTF